MGYTDPEIKRLVLEQLTWDSRLEGAQIEVSVENGVVALRGMVPSNFARQSADADILLIPGVKDVQNQTVVQNHKSPLISDAEIRARLMDRLLWNPNIEASNVDVLVSNGEVVLGGAVDAYWKKKRAEEIAFDIDGVRGVHNDLAVVPTHDYSDQQIASDIISALQRNVEISTNGIEIDVDKGRVTLGGSVTDIRQVNVVYEIARFTKGVKDIINLLKVWKKAA